MFVDRWPGREDAEAEVLDEGDAEAVGVLDEGGLVGEEGAEVVAVPQRRRRLLVRRHRVRHCGGA